MRSDYILWLKKQGYTEPTQNTQLYRISKVERSYGDLDIHIKNNTYQKIIEDLTYTASDERANRPNPSKISLGSNSNIRNNLASYKMAAIYYLNFINDDNFRPEDISEENELHEELSDDNFEFQQKFSIESDMQKALRQNILSLANNLTIIDDNKERIVESGRIDITCSDGTNIVAIELKAGTADSKAIGQILGYMGDLQIEENKPVKGILVAHDFDKRARAAARVVPTLTLKKYSIAFQFSDVE